MKTLLLAGFLASQLGAQAQALLPTAAPLRQANITTIHTRSNTQDAYHQLGQVLVAAGYDLNQASFVLHHRQKAYITTIVNFLPVRRQVMRVALQAGLVPDSTGTTIELRGTYTLNGYYVLPATRRRRKSCPSSLAWTELQRVASMFPTGVLVSYHEPY